MYLIFDAHEDLSLNMMDFGRDYRLSVEEIRAKEAQDKKSTRRPPTLLGWPEYNRGRVALVNGTLFEGPAHQNPETKEWSAGYRTRQEANMRYWRHPAYYHKIAEENPAYIRLIQTKADLDSHLKDWETQDPNDPKTYKPVGLLQLIEGAEGISGPDELPSWWEAGVRTIGLAWQGNQYCGGSKTPGPLTTAGKELVREIEKLGFCLDIAHLDEASVWDVFDIFHGPIIASHANARRLVKNYSGNRLLSDEVIKALIERDGVMGIVPTNHFLDMSHERNTPKSAYPLQLVIDQFDYICQLAGDAKHVGYGTDFDGGFGVDDVPEGINSIADLPKILDTLKKLGYSGPQLEDIASGNFMRVIKSILP